MSTISNLQPRPRIFTLVNSVKINKDTIKVGTNHHVSIDEDMEIVDFSETISKPRK